MNKKVLIYQPVKNPMQSGKYKSCRWFLKFANNSANYTFNLMNWIGSENTLNTINMSFETKEDAIEFAKKQGFEIETEENNKPILKAKSYADNF